jgi:serine protease Do
VKYRGHAGATFLAALFGVLIGAGIVWMLASRHGGGGGVIFGSSGPGPLAQVTESSEGAIVSAVKNVGPAVVNISTFYAPPETSQTERMLRQAFGLPQQPFPREGEGSGVIIDAKDGYILTNAHVVRGAAKVRVRLSDKREFDARVVGSDAYSDVAVVQIKGDKLPVAQLGSVAKVPIGSWVIAIGNPFGFQNSVTVGVVSAKGRDLPSPSGIELQDLIQTDASINPGNSGGALVDLNGEVIGIPTAMIPQAQGMGFAVSVDSARDVLEKLIKTGKMPWLGVLHHFLAPDEARTLRVPGGKGTVVMRVVQGGPADRAGIRAKDVIVKMGDHPIDSDRALGAAIRAYNAGDTVNALIWRESEGREVTVKVTLGAVPQQEGGEPG